jgi:hypothetical protein
MDNVHRLNNCINCKMFHYEIFPIYIFVALRLLTCVPVHRDAYSSCMSFLVPCAVATSKCQVLIYCNRMLKYEAKNCACARVMTNVSRQKTVKWSETKYSVHMAQTVRIPKEATISWRVPVQRLTVAVRTGTEVFSGLRCSLSSSVRLFCRHAYQRMCVYRWTSWFRKFKNFLVLSAIISKTLYKSYVNVCVNSVYK